MRKIGRYFKQQMTLLLCLFAVTAWSCSQNNSEPEVPTIAATGISLSQTEAILTVGQQIPLTATITPKDATDKTYAWSSSDSRIATVESDILTAHAAGNAIITAVTADGKYKAECTVSVIIEAAGISLSQESVMLDIGQSLPIVVTITPEDATEIGYTWTSSNEEVATVVDDTIQAHAYGKTTITATTLDGNFSASCEVTVAIIMTGGKGYYFGDQWWTGSDNSWLILTSGEVTESEFNFQGNGTAVLFDMNTTKTGQLTIPSGLYKALLEDPESSQDFTFLPGTDMGPWGIVGSFIYSRTPGASDASWNMIEDGEVNVTASGTNYTVFASVRAADGKSYTIAYQGELIVRDGTGGSGGGGGSEYNTIEMKNLTQGELDFWGKAYGTSMGSDYNNWMIYLADATFDMDSFTGTGEMLQLEINTAGSATTDITPGTYEIFTDFGPDSFTAFSAVPAFIQDQVPYGTWHIKDLIADYGATSGTAKISKSGTNYTIEFEFKDEEASPVTIFKGSYTGPLSFYDYSQAPASVRNTAAKVSRKAFVPTPKRMRFRK